VDTSKLQMSVEQVIPLPLDDTFPEKVATGEHPQFVDDNLLRDLNEPDEKNGNNHQKP
jgi:hypothetical protein